MDPTEEHHDRSSNAIDRLIECDCCSHLLVFPPLMVNCDNRGRRRADIRLYVPPVCRLTIKSETLLWLSTEFGCFDVRWMYAKRRMDKKCSSLVSPPHDSLRDLSRERCTCVLVEREMGMEKPISMTFCGLNQLRFKQILRTIRPFDITISITQGTWKIFFLFCVFMIFQMVIDVKICCLFSFRFGFSIPSTYLTRSLPFVLASALRVRKRVRILLPKALGCLA